MRHYLVALALLIAPLLALAQAPLELAADAQVLRTAGHLEWLDDPGGTLDVDRAGRASGWAALPGNLSASYTRSAIWLRLRLAVPQPGQWMLLLRNPLLDDVRVYTRAEDDAWHVLGASGEDVPRRLWPVDFRSAAFPFQPAQAGTYTVLVRVTARNAVNTALDVWQRLGFDNHTRREGFVFGLYFGFYLLLISLHALFWRATRAPASGLFLAYVGLCVSVELLTLGLVQQLTGLPGTWSDRLLGMSLALSYPVAMQMAARQLRLRAAWPQLVRALQAAAGATALACTVLVLSGHYAAGVQLLQALATPTLLLLPCGLALWLLRRGQPHAGLFLIVFSPYYAGALMAFARNMGLLPFNAFTENASALCTMVHMVLLSLWIVGSHDRQRRARERARKSNSRPNSPSASNVKASYCRRWTWSGACARSNATSSPWSLTNCARHWPSSTPARSSSRATWGRRPRKPWRAATTSVPRCSACSTWWTTAWPMTAWQSRTSPLTRPRATCTR